MKQQHKIAFTLSEVLISLVIIGIIAAMTFPLIYANYQEKAIKSSLKKNYSVLQQSLDRYYIDNGVRLVNSDITLSGVYHTFKYKLTPYLNLMQDCGWGHSDRNSETAQPCVNYDDFNNVYSTYTGKTITQNYFDDGQFILNDGSIIFINDYNGLLFISVDVNGKDKKPNRLGKDLFMFELDENGSIIPMGAKGTKYYSNTNAYCSETSSNSMNGAGCTYKILLEK
ncbi:MAG: type II secretion system GspH family protein [Candidatus Gastranaerophilales bacterium]|nr:type II secretion system GspH family protein [Candidatus Gastranaerophilales bacterium]